MRDFLPSSLRILLETKRSKTFLLSLLLAVFVLNLPIYTIMEEVLKIASLPDKFSHALVHAHMGLPYEASRIIQSPTPPLLAPWHGANGRGD